jgi:AraC-like DNA-binding protein
MSQMTDLFERFDLPELFSESNLEGVRFFKSHHHTPRTPLIYDPGIFIVAQGRKKGFLSDLIFQYDANNYLVTSLPIPFECETFATEEAPFLGLYIDINMPVLHEMIGQLGAHNRIDTKKNQIPKGVGPAKMDDSMHDAVVRLLKCLQSKTESEILGPCLIKEILYRVLRGTQASSLLALAEHNSHFAGVSRSLQSIHSDYASKLDVEQLAEIAGLSVSSYHRAFKKVTSESPVQYLKKIRLTRARDFIINHQMKAYIAADEVGYESPSQFSREFKRYFGQSPAEMIKESRKG